MFQFHTGSIKSRLSTVIDYVKLGFNSILVRLKVEETPLLQILSARSIPYWFD